MKVLLYSLLILSPVLLSAQNKKVDNLIGKWEGAYHALVYTSEEAHFGDVKMELKIEKEKHGFLWASHTWALDDQHSGDPDIDGASARGGTEQLYGLISFDHKEVIFQEVHDNGTFKVSVVNANTLEAIYTERDEKGGTMFKVVLKKKRP